MKRCKRCNKPLLDTATVCPTCGATCDVDADATTEATGKPRRTTAQTPPTETAAEAPARKRKRRKKRRIPTIALLVAALAIAVAIILVATKSCRAAKPGLQPSAALTGTQIAPEAPDASAARVEVPTLIGMTLADASAKLSELGLVADLYASDYDPAYPDGYVFSQNVAAGERLTKGDHVALSANELPLTLTVLQSSVRSGRITLGNLLTICRAMGTNNPNFDYSIVIHAVEDYEIKGGFRCLVGTGEETPISRVNTQFLREGKLVNGMGDAVAYKDAIVWPFALEDWMGFHFENVTGFDVYLSNRVDTATAVTKSFLPEQTKSMALIDCPTGSGRVRVDIPTDGALAIRITDSALASGYPNSPGGAGNGVPKWEVKLVESSYKWISATVDGAGGEAQDAMRTTGQRFTEKGGSATTFAGVTYTVGGDVMVISVPIPADMDFDPYAVSYVELSFGDGAYAEKIKVQ